MAARKLPGAPDGRNPKPALRRHYTPASATHHSRYWPMPRGLCRRNPGTIRRDRSVSRPSALSLRLHLDERFGCGRKREEANERYRPNEQRKLPRPARVTGGQLVSDVVYLFSPEREIPAKKEANRGPLIRGVRNGSDEIPHQGQNQIAYRSTKPASICLRFARAAKRVGVPCVEKRAERRREYQRPARCRVWIP